MFILLLTSAKNSSSKPQFFLSSFQSTSFISAAISNGVAICICSECSFCELFFECSFCELFFELALCELFFELALLTLLLLLNDETGFFDSELWDFFFEIFISPFFSSYSRNWGNTSVLFILLVIILKKDISSLIVQ